MKVFGFLIILCSFGANAQELFPHNEPASSIPKNVIGIRTFGDSYNENGTQRNLAALRLMYGLTPRVSMMATGTFSNHHSKYLPSSLITHTHTSTGNTNYQTGSFPRGLKYPYRFNGVYFYGKYRFLTEDGKNTHYRMAAYAEYSFISAAHDETEPNLLDDTKGCGFGLIATYLKKHFAVSITSGLILPGKYSEITPDFYGGELHTILQYGRALKYNLSFGYLIYPSEYSSYSETNINVYLEFMGKSYQTAKVIQNDIDIKPQTELLLGSHYVEFHPGIQAIINSNMRIDFSVGVPIINKSFTRFYPVYMIGIQRYFFL
ncbi:MAG: hypothetical protein IPQ03_14960 [Bacteroidetes bacterium]|nr:hypothetical protein [Bacteroidota bacterium]MBK9541379.1 hypothetical protein [Bacteroidota bacterium]MBL0258742.1 hypothetical protein [Bacteroidota bacterium]MBP6401364.1 hypothetical protein [Bacteroidia bacterium]MBP6648174.1 hypothetical protein [Bacteroidia bacterium]